MMRVSDITVAVVKNYLRIDGDEDDTLIAGLLGAARAYVKTYTGRTAEELDAMEDVAFAVLVIVGEMYDNRAMTVSSATLNPLVAQVLGSHSANLM